MQMNANHRAVVCRCAAGIDGKEGPDFRILVPWVLPSRGFRVCLRSRAATLCTALQHRWDPAGGLHPPTGSLAYKRCINQRPALEKGWRWSQSCGRLGSGHTALGEHRTLDQEGTDHPWSHCQAFGLCPSSLP